MDNTVSATCMREADRYLGLASEARARADAAAREGHYGEAMTLHDIERQHFASRWDALQAAKRWDGLEAAKRAA